MKGISVMISAVLLILLVVVISTVLASWLTTLSSSETSKIRNTTQEQLGCQFADIYIKNITYNCTTTCSSAGSRNTTVTVVNSGKKTVNVSTVVLRNTTGNIFIYDVGLNTLNVGDEVALSNASTDLCTGINGTLDEVTVSTINCPGTAYDVYPGSAVTFLSC